MFFRMNTGSLFSDQWWFEWLLRWRNEILQKHESPWFWRMMNPPPHFIERRVLHIISCHDSKGTQHCGWCSNSTLPLAALSLFRGVQETGWPALICPTMCNYVQLCATIISKRWKSSHTILHGRTKRTTDRVACSSYMCNKTTSTFSDNSPTRLNMHATNIMQQEKHHFQEDENVPKPE